MPAPNVVLPFWHGPMLPPALAAVARATLRLPHATSDHLLLLADACVEAIHDGAFDHLEQEAVLEMADELRSRSPDYA